MLEPFTALSLATAIVAFVDFGGKLVKTGYRVFKSAQGVTEEDARLEGVTNDLALISQRLSDSLRANEGPLTHDDHRLQEMGEGCSELAGKLLAMLEGLRVTGSGGLRGWRALRKSLERHVKIKAEIDEIAGQLNMYRQQISTHLLHILRNNQSTTLEELRRLDDTSRRLHRESLDELHGIKRDLLAVARSHEQLVDRYKFWSRAGSNELDEERDLLRSIAQKMQLLEQRAAPLATEFHILDSLFYEQMYTRHRAIKDTYPKTFSWIFGTDATNFTSWLEQDSGIFWVRGKAGSGKSTLMKFLSDHERTPGILQRWAGSKKLVTASFYFWNAGEPMEKSQEGLLQSLLFQILKQCPELIPAVTPARWQGDNAFHRYQRPWDRKELSDALRAALSVGSLPSRFCFFVDGLDEFAGDYGDLAHAGQSVAPKPDYHALIKDLEALASSEDVKMCVSSRPWNPFVTAFGEHEDRMLVLEELTKDDMSIYIRGMLEEDSRFQRLIQQDPSANELVSEIRDKAQGVFLWVFLAVRSLLRGLTELDSVAELQARLRSLPSDLKQFFHRILITIDEEYRPLTCRMLLMTKFADSKLPLLAFWFLTLELDCPDYALLAKAEPLGPAAHRLKSSAATSINKWCRDLLEIDFKGSGLDASLDLLDSSVGFLHRTVRDFLSDADVSSYLWANVSSDFNPRLAAMRLHLAQLKLLPASLTTIRAEKVFEYFHIGVEQVLSHAKSFETETHRPAVLILQELDSVGEHFYGSTDRHWTDKLPIAPGDSRGRSTFLSLTVSFDLVLFVQDALTANPSLLFKRGKPLLGYVLDPICRGPYTVDAATRVCGSTAMVETLLRAGADPNEQGTFASTGGASRASVWQAFLFRCYHDQSKALHDTALAFLRHGVDMDCKVRIASSRSPFAPIGNLTGSRHTRVDPSRGEFTEKEFASAEECLINVLSQSELGNALAGWRPREKPRQTADRKAVGWFSWAFG